MRVRTNSLVTSYILLITCYLSMDTPNAVPAQVIEPTKKEKKNSWLIYFLMFIIILLVAAVSAAVTYIVIKDSEENNSEESQENTDEQNTQESSDSTSEDDEDSEEIPDERALRVYFQKFPEATDDFSFVDAVFRTTSRTDETIFVLEEFLSGPTSVEEAQGFKGIEPVSLSGSSNCGGKDFKLTISGSEATFQFCKTTTGLSDNTSQVSVPILENIKYYNSEVTKVIILDKDGNCFNDLSGMNACLL